MAVTFEQAFAAAAERFSPESWSALTPAHQAAAIYEEMRRLDAALDIRSVNPTTPPVQIAKGRPFRDGP